MDYQLLLNIIFGILALSAIVYFWFKSYHEKREERIASIATSDHLQLPDFENYHTNQQHNFNQYLKENKVLVVFLRHFGCTFCRSTIAFLSDERLFLEAKGIEVLFVHPGSEEQATRAFERWNYADAHWVADPELKLYNTFHLKKGNFKQLFGIETWIEGFKFGIIGKKGVGLKQEGNGFQMPGVFYVQDGIVKAKFIHERASDMPDYLELFAYSKDYIQQSVN